MLDAVPDGTLPPSQLNASRLAEHPGTWREARLFTLQGHFSSPHHLVGTYLDKQASLGGSSEA